MTHIDTEHFQNAALTLSLCLLHFQSDDLQVISSLDEALSVVNIASGLQDLNPKDKTLEIITKNLKLVSLNYVSKPQIKLSETPIQDTLFQLIYNLRIALDYIRMNYTHKNN